MRWSPTIALALAMVGLLLFAGGARAAELVRDGGFEGGGSGWVQEDSANTPSICGPSTCPTLASMAAPRSGNWWTWFGGFNLISFGQTSSVSQTVEATAGTPLTLTFWLWLGQSSQTATLNVLLDDHALFAVRGNDGRFGHGYAPVTVAIPGSLVTGGAQRLRFEFESVPGLLSYHAINIDDISLQAPDVDLGVGLASTPATVTQGGTFATTISAGNTGPHGANDVWTAFPLPTGATLVGLTGDASCAAAETAPGHVMHCDFGTLPTGASKAVTATFRADAVGTISQHATIAGRTGDANGGNHAAQAAVTVVAPTTAPPTTPPAKQPTCTPARRFTVPIRRGKTGTALMIGTHRTANARILSARLTGPKKFRTVKLRHTRSKVTVDLRKLAAGRYTVRARVRVSSRKTVNATRTYTACGVATKSAATSEKSTAKSDKAADKSDKSTTKSDKATKK